MSDVPRARCFRGGRGFCRFSGGASRRGLLRGRPGGAAPHRGAPRGGTPRCGALCCGAFRRRMHRARLGGGCSPHGLRLGCAVLNRDAARRRRLRGVGLHSGGARTGRTLGCSGAGGSGSACRGTDGRHLRRGIHRRRTLGRSGLRCRGRGCGSFGSGLLRRCRLRCRRLRRLRACRLHGCRLRGCRLCRRRLGAGRLRGRRLRGSGLRGRRLRSTVLVHGTGTRSAWRGRFLGRSDARTLSRRVHGFRLEPLRGPLGVGVRRNGSHPANLPRTLRPCRTEGSPPGPGKPLSAPASRSRKGHAHPLQLPQVGVSG